MNVQVECYAARKADERPVRFRLDEHEYVVTEMLDQWYGPEHVFFKVRADDGCLYILRHETSVPDGNGSWCRFESPIGGDMDCVGKPKGPGEEHRGYFIRRSSVY